MVGLAGVTMLVIAEGDAATCSVTHMLRTFGVCDVARATIAPELSALTAEQSFGAIILDMAAASLEIGAALQTMRRDGRNPCQRTPIVALAGEHDQPLLQALNRAGITDVIRKPIIDVDLYGRLQIMLSETRPFILSRDYAGPDRRRTEQGLVDILRASGLAPLHMRQAAQRRDQWAAHDKAKAS